MALSHSVNICKLSILSVFSCLNLLSGKFQILIQDACVIIIDDFFNTYQFIGNRHVTPQNSMMNFYWRIELIIVIVELYHVDCTVQAQLSLSVVS